MVRSRKARVQNVCPATTALVFHEDRLGFYRLITGWIDGFHDDRILAVAVEAHQFLEKSFPVDVHFLIIDEDCGSRFRTPLHHKEWSAQRRRLVDLQRWRRRIRGL